jgi:hypothetical protein
MKTMIKKTAAPKKKMQAGGMTSAMATLDKGKKKKTGSGDPLGGGKPNCKMGKCGPSAGASRSLSRQKSNSAKSFAKPKFKRTKVKFRG